MGGSGGNLISILFSQWHRRQLRLLLLPGEGLSGEKGLKANRRHGLGTSQAERGVEGACVVPEGGQSWGPGMAGHTPAELLGSQR